MKKLFFAVVVMLVLTANSAFALTIQGHDYELLSSSVNPVGAPAYVAGQDLGYFLWATDDSRRNWSLRWSGDGNAAGKTGAEYRFSGTVVLSSNTFSVAEFSFENDDSNDINFLSNSTSYFAIANTGHDGLDFTIMGDFSPSYIGFDLNITAKTASSTDVSDNNAFIFIGADKTNPTTGDFAMAAPVPEPGTLILLGSGLIGLAYLKRRKKA